MRRTPLLLRRFLPAVLPLLLPSLVQAKADTIRTNQGVEIFISKNQSKKLKLIVEAHIFDGESSLTEYARAGAGLNVDYIWRRFFSVHAGYSATYFSLHKHQSQQESYTQNALKNFSIGDAGFRIHILDGKGWAKRKITLQSFRELNEKGMPRTTVRFLKAKYPCRRIVALRGGAYYSTAPIGANLNGDLSKIADPEARGSVTTADGTVFTGSYYTNTTTTGVYAGLTKIINMKFRSSSTIEWLEGESKLTAIFKENYADVIFANTTIDPFVVDGKQYPITPNAPGSFKVTNIGWRIGGRMIATEKSWSTGVNYEVGVRPGLAQRGAYVRIGVTIALTKK